MTTNSSLLKLYVFSLAWLGLCVIFLFQSLSWIAFGWFLSTRVRIKWMSWIFNFIAFYTYSLLQPVWKVSLDIGELPKQLPRKLIVMSNHISQADPWSISRLFWSPNHHWLKYVGKGDLFQFSKTFIASLVLRSCGDLPVWFTADKNGWAVDPNGKRELMRLASEYVEEFGFPIMVFPEGGCSHDGELKAFRLGFFQFAIDHQCAILPLAITGAGSAWCPKSNIVRTSQIRFGVHSKMLVPEPKESAEELMMRTREIIQRLKTQLESK